MYIIVTCALTCILATCRYSFITTYVSICIVVDIMHIIVTIALMVTLYDT